MLDLRAARGIHSGHRGNFSKPIQERVPWDAAKPEGHATPPYKSWSSGMRLSPPENLNSFSTYSNKSIESWNIKSWTILNSSNSLSAYWNLCIYNFNAASTTILVNSFLTNADLRINNWNTTSTTTFYNFDTIATNTITFRCIWSLTMLNTSSTLLKF